MKLNIFDVRFVDNENDSVFHVSQYGNTEKEITDYWKEYFKHGRNADRFSYIDAVLVEKNADIDEHKFKKHLNIFDLNKMHEVEH